MTMRSYIIVDTDLGSRKEAPKSDARDSPVSRFLPVTVMSHPHPFAKWANALAAPPEPMISTRRSSASNPALSRAVRIPTMSVLLPISLPFSLVTVFTAPTAEASLSTASRWSMISCL